MTRRKQSPIWLWAALGAAFLLPAAAGANDLGNATWSELDSGNNAAPPNGWPEGMLPSGVNDTGRAMQGGLKRFWDQLNYTQTATGTANAQVLTYQIAPAAYYIGQIFDFIALGPNSGPVTLNAGAGAKAVVDQNSAALVGGELQNGHATSVFYDGTNFRLLSGTASASGGGGGTSSVLINATVSAAGDNSSSKTSVSASTAIASGHGVVVGCKSGGSSATNIIPPTDTAGDTFVQIGSTLPVLSGTGGSGPPGQLALFYTAQSLGQPRGFVTCSFVAISGNMGVPTPVAYAAAFVLEYNKPLALDVTHSLAATQPATGVTTAPLVTSFGNEVVPCIYGTWGTPVTWSAGLGYTARLASPGATAGMQDMLAISPGSVAASVSYMPLAYSGLICAALH